MSSELAAEMGAQGLRQTPLRGKAGGCRLPRAGVGIWALFWQHQGVMEGPRVLGRSVRQSRSHCRAGFPGFLSRPAFRHPPPRPPGTGLREGLAQLPLALSALYHCQLLKAKPERPPPHQS